MSKVNKLLKQLGNLSFQARKLESDEYGNLLLDSNNLEDVEWYENDEAYEIIPNEFLIDQQDNIISRDKGSDVIY